jgi:FlaA1/EpsC-like NDP-sugar epimerase
VEAFDFFSDFFCDEFLLEDFDFLVLLACISTIWLSKMLKKYYSVFGPTHRVIDALILSTCWLLSYYLRKHYPLSIMTAEIPKFTIFRDYLVFMLLLWGTVFSFSNLYSSQRLVPRSIEAWRILRAHSLATLLFVALTYLVSTYKLSRGVFLYFYISSSFGFVFSRMFLRFILRSLRKRGHNLHRVLFIGASKASLAVYNKLIKHPELGLEIVGFIEGKLSGTTTNSSNISATALPKPCLGSIDQLKSIIEEWHIYRVIIALERDQALNVDIALNQLKDSMAEIILIPDVYEYLQLGLHSRRL